MSLDICPKCCCNNAPMVWLGKGKGWICEDCIEKLEVKQDARREGKGQEIPSILPIHQE